MVGVWLWTSDEIERKYDVGSDVVFPDLSEVGGVGSVGQAG